MHSIKQTTNKKKTTETHNKPYVQTGGPASKKKDRFLVIQTAFIGDVILATPVIEKLHCFYPGAKIDILIRQGNETLFENHPFIHEILILNKKKQKLFNLYKTIKRIRKTRYDHVINLHRFLSSGIITALSGASNTWGFNKNPVSFLFDHVVQHEIHDNIKPVHEAERNLSVIKHLTNHAFTRPALYPSNTDYKAIQHPGQYISIAPASVWHTKQLPPAKWIELINYIGQSYKTYLIGGSDDQELCEYIKEHVHTNIENLAGKTSFLQTAALMQNATMNFVNDSAPMHLASAVDAPVTAVFCSTIPAFGFTPLSNHSFIIETDNTLTCRPCGIHGHEECPLGHFQCADIDIKKLAAPLLAKS